MRAFTVVSSVHAPARASVKTSSRARVRARRFRSSSRASVVVSAVDAQSLSEAIGWDSAVQDGCIVFAARFGALGLGKAKQGSDIERALEMCETRGIDVRDLYYDEDQGEQRWYLVGNWSVPKKGDPRYGDGRMSQELKSRVRYHDGKKAADEAGVNYADIEELAALYPTTPKRAVELRRRLKDAGKEIEWDI